MKKSTILVLGLSLILPISASTAYADETDNYDHTIYNEIMDGGSYIEIETNRFPKLNGSGYYNSAKMTRAIPDDPVTYMISLQELAENVKDTPEKFDYEIKDNKIIIKKGVNYSGPKFPAFKADDRSFGPANDKYTIVNGDYETEVYVYKLRGRDTYIERNTLMKALDAEEVGVLDTIGQRDLLRKFKDYDYTVVASYNKKPSEREANYLLGFSRSYIDSLDYKLGFISLTSNLDLTSQRLKVNNIALPFHPYTVEWLEGSGYDTEFFKGDDLHIIVVDKNGKQVGKSFSEYVEEYKNFFITENKLTVEDFNKKYGKSFEEEIENIVYSNFLKYAIDGKKVSLDDVKDPNKTPSKEDLLRQKEKLEKAVRNNEIIVSSAKYLLENTPKTVRNVKEQLKEMIKEAEKLQEQGRKAIKDLNKKLENL